MLRSKSSEDSETPTNGLSSTETEPSPMLVHQADSWVCRCSQTHTKTVTSGNKVLTLLEPSRYWIRQTMPFMRSDRSTQPKFEKDMISYRTLAASGGTLVHPGAAVSLELA